MIDDSYPTTSENLSKSQLPWWKLPESKGLAVLYAVVMVGFWACSNRSEAGQFGDTFGVLNAAVQGVAFLLLIQQTQLQREELRLQRKELELARSVQEQQAIEAGKLAEATDRQSVAMALLAAASARSAQATLRHDLGLGVYCTLLHESRGSDKPVRMRDEDREVVVAVEALVNAAEDQLRKDTKALN
jgi:hypothetical protein